MAAGYFRRHIFGVYILCKSFNKVIALPDRQLLSQIHII
jgi:hypothetical protein